MQDTIESLREKLAEYWRLVLFEVHTGEYVLRENQRMRDMLWAMRPAMTYLLGGRTWCTEAGEWIKAIDAFNSGWREEQGGDNDRTP